MRLSSSIDIPYSDRAMNMVAVFVGDEVGFYDGIAPSSGDEDL